MIDPSSGARASAADAGFSLVEVIVAIVILAVGVLGLAGTTALAVRQVTVGGLATERAFAAQSAIERLRSLEWENIDNGATTVGSYAVSWWIDEDHAQSRVMKIVTVGPGISTASGFVGMRPDVADTFTYRLLRY